MGLFEPVYAYLYLFHIELFQYLSIQQQAIAKQDLAEGEFRQHIIYLLKVRVHQGLASRNEYPQPLHLIELLQEPSYLFDRKPVFAPARPPPSL